jgi:lysophospholipase L1-like esterase
VCIGDSLTYREGALWESFRDLVQDRYGDAGPGWQSHSRWTGAIINPTWEEGLINNDVPPYRGLDGLWLRYQPPGNVSTYINSWSAITRFYYVAEPGGGNVFVSPTSAPGTFLNTNTPTQQIRWIDVNHTQQPYRTWFYPQAGSGPVTLLGQVNRSSLPGPLVHRAANGGWRVQNFLQRDWTFDALLQQLDPDLYLIMLGQNNGALSPGAFGAEITQLITRLRATTPDAEIVLISSYDSGVFWAGPFANALLNVAVQQNVGFIDFWQASGPYAFFEQNGYLDADGLHFSPTGGMFVANLVLNALETGGASLTPCSDIDFDNDGLYPDTADIDALVSVFGGAPCPTPFCDSIDFNRDLLFPDTADIDAFLRVFSGGTCE